MTLHDSPRFFAALARLAVLHRVQVDKAMGRVYFEALTDVPIDTLESALDYLTRHAGDFFPKTEEIRAVCNDVEETRVRMQPETPPQQSQFALEASQADHVEKTIALPSGPMTVKVAVGVSGSLCDRCDDSGWKQICACENPGTCSGRDGDHCAQYRNGGVRLPVQRCECHTTNPEILRRRAGEKAAAPSYTWKKKKRTGFTGERSYYERERD